MIGKFGFWGVLYYPLCPDPENLNQKVYALDNLMRFLTERVSFRFFSITLFGSFWGCCLLAVMQIEEKNTNA